MSRRRFRVASFSLALSVLPVLIPTGLAQVTTGTILGTVGDTTGGALPGATVTAANVETGIARSVVSDAEGRYRISSLGLGDYEVRAELTGFLTEVRSGIRLTVGREATVDFSLGVGQLSESIQVTGEAPLVETTRSEMGGVVSTEQVSTLPLNSRDFAQLMTLQAGAIQYRGAGGNVQSGFGTRIAVSGARTSMNAFSLDGININAVAGQLPSGVGQATLGVESVREFKVLTSNYSAEYGRAAGANIVAVTKSGTNNFHGSGYEYLRNDNLDSANYFDTQKPAFKRNQFGLSLGGPILKRKTFFFVNYEGLRERLGRTAIGSVPTAAARQGVLPTRTVVVDPRIAPYVALYPAPNGRDRGDGTAEFISAINQPTDQNYYTFRVDHQLSGKYSLMGRFTSDLSDRLDPEVLGLFATESQTRNRSFVFEAQTIFSPRWLGVARVGFSRDVSQANIVGCDEINPSLSFVEGRPFGNIGVSGLSALAGCSSATEPYNSHLTSPQFHYALSYVAGRHSIKAGASVERLILHRDQDQLQGGTITFGSVADFLINARPTRFRMKGPDRLADPFRSYLQTLTAFYLQDDFTVHPRFTVNVGVRHEYSTTPTEKFGRLANIREVLDPVSTVGEPFFKNPQATNFGPRVGFAWDPTGSGKMSVRGGFGIFFEPLTAKQYLVAMVLQPPFWSTPDPIPSSGQLDGLFPNVTQANLEQFAKGPESVFSFDFEPESPHMTHFSLAVQRALPADIVLTANYTRTRGDDLIYRADWSVPVPQFLPDGRTFYPPGSPRLNPNFGGFRQFKTGAKSWYDGLQLTVARRFAEGAWGTYQFQGSYTLSKNIDIISGHIGSEVDEATISDGFDLDRDKGLAATDVRHNFVANFSYAPPFGSTATGLAAQLLRGWEISGIVSLAAGNPTSLASNAAITHPNLGGPAVRPDLIPGGDNNPVLGDPDLYFDVSQFAPQQPGFNGNVGRNTLIGPGVALVDFSLLKNFHLPKSQRFQFRLELFNALNRANFASPSTTLFNNRGQRLGAAGVITRTTTTARQIQLAVRYEF
jgi:hypothetical protein